MRTFLKFGLASITVAAITVAVTVTAVFHFRQKTNEVSSPNETKTIQSSMSTDSTMGYDGSTSTVASTVTNVTNTIAITTVAVTTTGKTTVGGTPIGQTAVGVTAARQTTVSDTHTGQITVGVTPIGQTSLGFTPTGQTSVGVTTARQTTIGITYDTSTSSTPMIQSQYISLLATDSQTYCRQGPCPSSIYYYEAIQINVSIRGNYNIVSDSFTNSVGYLYNSSFNTTAPLENLLSSSYANSSTGQFIFITVLEPITKYILVVTTYNTQVIGVFSIIANGPALLSFSPLYISNNSNSSTVKSVYSSTLTESSSTFCHRGSCPAAIYYYQAIQINVSTNGSYTIQCGSRIDTYGYLYINSFNATALSANFLSSNDDGGGNVQFMFMTTLQAMTKYILVVTTFHQQTTGLFSIVARGPAPVSFIGG